MKTLPEWTDLRFFLELARSGTLSGASRRLEVEHTTVSRRIDRLEQQLGATLFDRSREGYELTEMGHAVLPHAEAMESAVLAAQGQLSGTEVAIRGVVRGDFYWGTGPEAGVQAGRLGGFGLVVGVDRGDNRHRLIEAGADLVVSDLDELSVEVLDARFQEAAQSRARRETAMLDDEAWRIEQEGFDPAREHDAVAADLHIHLAQPHRASRRNA